MLIWAGLFVAVLYSPIVSPDLETKHKYILEQENANYGRIENISSVSKKSMRKVQSMPFLTYESEMNNYAYKVTAKEQFEANQKSDISLPFNKIENHQTKVNMDLMVTENVESRSIMKNNTKNVSTNNNVFSVSSDLASLDDNIRNRQGNNYSSNLGGTDPGDDPTGNPIPIGDGWVFMLILAVGYALKKMRFL